MHILEKNIRDRAKVTPIVDEVSCAGVDKELMHIIEKNIRHRAKVTPIVDESPLPCRVPALHCSSSSNYV